MPCCLLFLRIWYNTRKGDSDGFADHDLDPGLGELLGVEGGLLGVGESVCVELLLGVSELVGVGLLLVKLVLDCE